MPRGEILEQKTEAYIGEVWYTIARNQMAYNEHGKRIRSENLAGRIATKVAQGEGGLGLKTDMVLPRGLSPESCTDLSQPRGEWLSTSWFVDFEGDRAVVSIPEMFLENARGAIEDATGRASGGLFLMVGIATDTALGADSFTLLVAE